MSNVIMTEGNLEIIEDLDRGVIAQTMMAGAQRRSIHMTNGTYGAPGDLIVPTMLAGFRFIVDRFSPDFNDVLGLAVNSDISMFGIYRELAIKAVEKRLKSDLEHAGLLKDMPEDELDDRLKEFQESDLGQEIHHLTVQTKMAAHESAPGRAVKVAAPLAREHPRHRVFVSFYDEGTPHDLYTHFQATDGLDTSSLHKWDYGIDPKGPKIVGAECFTHVVGFPLPKDADKPLCHTITVSQNQSRKVKVFNLMNEKGPSGQTYLTTDGKVAYTVTDQRNAGYTAPHI